LYLLTPKMDKFTRMKSSFHLPIIMLYGDTHGSDEFQCTNCTCNSKGCCLAVYDEKFLQLLDSLASPSIE